MCEKEREIDNEKESAIACKREIESTCVCVFHCDVLYICLHYSVKPNLSNRSYSAFSSQINVKIIVWLSYVPSSLHHYVVESKSLFNTNTTTQDSVFCWRKTK